MEQRVTEMDVDAARGELLQLTNIAFEAGRFGTSARCAAELVAPIPDLVAALDVPGVAADVRRLRRAVAAVAKLAQETAEAGAEATDLLADAGRVHAVPAPAEDRLRCGKRLGAAANRAGHRHLRLTRKVVDVARTAAGYAAVHEPCDGPEPLWDLARSLLAHSPLDEDEVVTFTLAGGQTDRRVLTGLFTHAGRQAPSRCTIEADAVELDVLLPGDGRVTVTAGGRTVLDDDTGVSVTALTDAVLAELRAGLHPSGLGRRPGRGHPSLG